MIELNSEKLKKMLMVIFCLCIVSSNTGKWSNYLNVGFIIFSLLDFLFQRRQRVSGLNLCWIIFIIVYPIFDHLIRGETALEIYNLFPYISAILLLANHFSVDDLIVLRNGIKIWAMIQTAGVILSQVWKRLYYILAGRIISYWSSKLTGFGLDPSCTAIAISMGIGIVFLEFVFLKDKMTKHNKLIMSCILLFMFYGLIMTGKRLIFVATVILCMVIILLNSIHNPRKFLYLAAMCALLLGLGYMASLFAYNVWGETNAIGRLGATIIGLSSGDDITSNRYIWAEMMNRWRVGHEFFGIGWESFRNRLALEGYRGVPNGHNVFLQILCEAGYFGFAFFGGLSIYSTFSAIKTCFQSHYAADNEYKVLAFFGFFSIGLFFLYCLTGNAIYDAFSYLYFFSGIYAISAAKKLIN